MSDDCTVRGGGLDTGFGSIVSVVAFGSATRCLRRRSLQSGVRRLILYSEHRTLRVPTVQPTRSAISAGGTFCATSVGINASTASVKIGFLIAWPHRMLARVARCRSVSYCDYSQPKAAEPPLWLANGSASGKAFEKVFLLL
jgi:hypothetical protein